MIGRASCGGGTSQTEARLTYHRDVEPIVDAKCAGLCHHPDGIAPFTLMSYSDLMLETSRIRSDVANVASCTRGFAR